MHGDLHNSAHTTPNALRSFAGRSHHSGDAHLMLPHPHTHQIIMPAAPGCSCCRCSCGRHQRWRGGDATTDADLSPLSVGGLSGRHQRVRTLMDERGPLSHRLPRRLAMSCEVLVAQHPPQNIAEPPARAGEHPPQLGNQHLATQHQSSGWSEHTAPPRPSSHNAPALSRRVTKGSKPPSSTLRNIPS